MSEYQAWKRKPAVGCVFARFMAARPSEHGQVVEVIEEDAPKEIAAKLEACTARHVADPSSSVMTVAFASVKGTTKGLTTLARVAVELSSTSGWSVSYHALPATPVGDMVGVRIARSIPFGAGLCPSEVLVLGPFKEFPNTRRAPITVLEMFVGTPLDLDPKTRLPTEKANLAHARLEALEASWFESAWKRSEEGRRRSLGCAASLGCDPSAVPPKCHDQRAKAKYAFVVPQAIATSLGLVR